MANICAYIASRRFAFSETKVDAKTGLVRYFLVTGLGLLLNSGALTALVELAHTNPTIASIIVCLANAPVNYILHRKITFKIKS